MPDQLPENALSEAESSTQGFGAVKFLPSEELDLNLLGLVIEGLKLLDLELIFASHVTIGSSLGVNGIEQLQVANDGRGTQVKQVLEDSGNLHVALVHMAGAIGVDIEAHRLGNADGIGHLDECLVGNAGSYDILRDMTAGIGSATVHLTGILAAEGAAAVGTASAIGVHDDFASREASVAVGATDDELASGIDLVLSIGVNHGTDIGAKVFHCPRDEDIAHIMLDALLVHIVVVLGAHHNGIDVHGTVRITVILNGHLSLGVRAQIGHQI